MVRGFGFPAAEEAPSVAVDDKLRAEMGRVAIAAAESVGYVNAGTIEFLFDSKDNSYYFLEMNTRLQVEHPVTEAITGLDLVVWQLRVANGEKLPLQQQDLQINGHAIEARICAENPDKQFMPAIGDINVYALPEHVAFQNANALGSDVFVRVDSGVRAGDAISPYYCLLYTSDAADDPLCVDLGGRRIIKKKNPSDI